MHLTESILRRIAPTASKDAGRFVAPLNDTMKRYNINTLVRAAMFLAQVMHESMALHCVKELGNAKYFKKYEGRADLGNTHAGDGMRYCGRGCIQITGRVNYKACGAALGVDFVNVPALLEQPKYAALSAGWFWDSKHLNLLADKGDFVAVTKRINGGTNGLLSRAEYYAKAMTALQPLFS